MKHFLKIICILILVLSQNCLAANKNSNIKIFEDKDMTQALIQKVGDEIPTWFGTFLVYPKEYGNNIYLYGLINTSADLSKSNCKQVKYFYFNIGEQTLQFDENDIVDFGKQEMFKRAMCYLNYSNQVFNNHLNENVKKNKKLNEKFVVPDNE